MLSKNFLFCEEMNILSTWEELPRQMQGNKIVEILLLISNSDIHVNTLWTFSIQTYYYFC